MNFQRPRAISPFLVPLLFLAGFPSQRLALGSESQEIHVAVASNFSAPAKAIVTRFEKRTGHRVILVFGATGKHYAQITNGAPIDILLAADERRPRRLEQAGGGVPGSRFTYAIGRLVLWSAREDYVDGDGKVLAQRGFRHLAIANPKLAPYGEAARQVLQKLGLWEDLQEHLVRGENIGQTFQFVKTGNTELGFVSYSQVRQTNKAVPGSYWLVPQSLYQPIRQQAILVRDGAPARAFLSFVQGGEVEAILQEHGYSIP